MKKWENGFRTKVAIENKHVEPMKVKIGVNYDDAVKYKYFYDLEDMQNTSRNDLLKIKNADLEKICMELSVKKTGKKSVKVHSIMEGLSDILKNVTWTTNINLPAGEDAMKYIFENGLHEITTFYLVRNLAYVPARILEKDGQKIELPSRCAEGCKILMNNFNDYLWDDARQAVALAIIEKPELAYVENGFCRLTSEGYHLCKRAISHMFSKMRMNGNQKKDDSLETILCSDGGKSEKIVKTTEKSDAAYIKALSYNIPDFEELANNDFLVSFFRWLRTSKKYVKYSDDMQTIFSLKVEGMTNKQIMSTTGISRRIFDKCLPLLKEAYVDYGRKCYNTDLKESNQYGVTYRKSDVTCSGSYQFRYGDGNSWKYEISEKRLAEIGKEFELNRKYEARLKKEADDAVKNLNKSAEDAKNTNYYCFRTVKGKKLECKNNVWYLDGKAM